MFAVSFNCLIRYCDIDAASDEPRTNTTTRRAYFEKYMAAWPALFAPPTMNTSSSLVDIASVIAAP